MFDVELSKIGLILSSIVDMQLSIGMRTQIVSCALIRIS